RAFALGRKRLEPRLELRPVGLELAENALVALLRRLQRLPGLALGLVDLARDRLDTLFQLLAGLELFGREFRRTLPGRGLARRAFPGRRFLCRAPGRRSLGRAGFAFRSPPLCRRSTLCRRSAF